MQQKKSQNKVIKQLEPQHGLPDSWENPFNFENNPCFIGELYSVYIFQLRRYLNSTQN